MLQQFTIDPVEQLLSRAHSQFPVMWRSSFQEKEGTEWGLAISCPIRKVSRDMQPYTFPPRQEPFPIAKKRGSFPYITHLHKARQTQGPGS